MYIKIDKKDKRPLWLQIVDQVIEYIVDGQLSPGDPLVPTSQLARELRFLDLVYKMPMRNYSHVGMSILQGVAEQRSVILWGIKH